MNDFIRSEAIRRLRAIARPKVLGVILIVAIGAAFLAMAGKQRSATATTEIPAAVPAAAPADYASSPAQPVPAQPAAATNYVDPVACVQRSFDDMMRLLMEVRRAKPVDEVAQLTQNEYLFNGLSAQDLQQCPQDYRDAHVVMLQKIGITLALSRAVVMHGGSEAELQASIRATGDAVDALITVADRHVPGSRSRAEKDIA